MAPTARPIPTFGSLAIEAAPPQMPAAEQTPTGVTEVLAYSMAIGRRASVICAEGRKEAGTLGT